MRKVTYYYFLRTPWLVDFIIKIVGGALTFGLFAIALRRKFEREYTR